MPRSNGTQARHFVYSGTDLTSATNPESGTTSYQYDGAHHVTVRTDAKGQQTRYSYDRYGRLTQVQHWTGSPLAEDTRQRVDIYYDNTNPFSSTYSQNAWGRLAAVQLHGKSTGGDFYYMYSYNQAGRVTQQHLNYSFLNGPFDFDATYNWDNEGRMTQIGYPENGPVYQMQFDSMGRVGSMLDVTNGTSGAQEVRQRFLNRPSLIRIVAARVFALGGVAQEPSNDELARLLAAPTARDSPINALRNSASDRIPLLLSWTTTPPRGLGISQEELYIGLADAFGALKVSSAIPFLIKYIGLTRSMARPSIWWKSEETIISDFPSVQALVQMGTAASNCHRKYAVGWSFERRSFVRCHCPSPNCRSGRARLFDYGFTTSRIRAVLGLGGTAANGQKVAGLIKRPLLQPWLACIPAPPDPPRASLGNGYAGIISDIIADRCILVGWGHHAWRM
jgi:YD repeat-containing protein